MESVGIIKGIDKLGRLSVPKEMRDLFDIKSSVEVIVTTEGILLRNPEYVLVRKKHLEINKKEG